MYHNLTQSNFYKSNCEGSFNYLKIDRVIQILELNLSLSIEIWLKLNNTRLF